MYILYTEYRQGDPDRSPLLQGSGVLPKRDRLGSNFHDVWTYFRTYVLCIQCM